MFSFLKKKQIVITSPFTEKEVGVSGYPKLVEQIHNEFNSSGDRLLAEAKEIIAGIRIDNEAKANALKKLGFSNTREVIDADTVTSIKKEKENIANALEELSQNFPLYKFITKDMAMQICEKYNLVLGDVNQYTGFVPEKNVKKIEKFFEKDNELNVQYYISYPSLWIGGEYVVSFSKEQYDRQEAFDKELRQSTDLNYLKANRNRLSGSSKIRKGTVRLTIAAPLKDMKAEGYKLSGRIFTKEIPDPVVLAPIKKNGVDLFCIVTAWGDEASDPIVVNSIEN